MSESAQASITNYHRLGSLNNRNLFLTELEAQSLRSRHQQGFILRPFLSLEMAAFSLSSHRMEGEKERGREEGGDRRRRGGGESMYPGLLHFWTAVPS